MEPEPGAFGREREETLSDHFYRVIKDAIDRDKPIVNPEVTVLNQDEPDTEALPPISLTEDDIFTGTSLWDDVYEPSKQILVSAPGPNLNPKSREPQHARRPHHDLAKPRDARASTTRRVLANRLAVAAAVIVVALIGLVAALRTHGAGSGHPHQVAIDNTTSPSSSTAGPSTTTNPLVGAAPSDVPSTSPTETTVDGALIVSNVGPTTDSPRSGRGSSSATGQVTRSTGTVEGTVPPTSSATTVTPTTVRRPTSTVPYPPPSYSLPSYPIPTFTIPTPPTISIPPIPTTTTPTTAPATTTPTTGP